MSDYRFYVLTDSMLLSGLSNQTLGDDKAALEHARALARGRRLEIWNGKRLVSQVPADGGQAAA